MKTFLVVDGDVSIGVGGFESITGPRKLHQDLSFAVQEPFGSDRFHPRWGSLLSRFVGGFIDPTQVALVRNGIQRVMTNYMAYQQALMERDAVDRRKPRFGLGEVIRSVDDVSVASSAPSRLDTKIRITTMTNESIPLDVSVEQ